MISMTRPKNYPSREDSLNKLKTKDPESKWQLKTIKVNKTYTNEEFKKIKQGFKPKQMEDRWTIYLEDNILHFHRSWTKNWYMGAEFIKQENNYKLTNIITLTSERDKHKTKFDKTTIETLTTLINNIIKKDE